MSDEIKNATEEMVETIPEVAEETAEVVQEVEDFAVEDLDASEAQVSEEPEAPSDEKVEEVGNAEVADNEGPMNAPVEEIVDELFQTNDEAVILTEDADIPDAPAGEPAAEKAEPEAEPEEEPVEAVPEKAKPARTRTRTATGLTAESRVRTEQDLVSEDLMNLYDSYRNKTALTAKVTGVKVSNYDMGVVSLICEFGNGKYQVVIPSWSFQERYKQPDTKNPPNRADVDHLSRELSAFIGAEIDFIPDSMPTTSKARTPKPAIDSKGMVCVGTRLEGMNATMRDWYKRKNRNDGGFEISANTIIDARVTGVYKRGMYVEVRGKEFFVTPQNISSQRIYNLKEKYRAGDIVPVKVTKLERQETRFGNIASVDMEISLKAATEKSPEQLKRMYAPGTICTGKVQSVQPFAIFVRLDGDDGATCRCSLQRVGTPLGSIRLNSEARVTITGYIEEKGQFKGYINQILPPRA